MKNTIPQEDKLGWISNFVPLPCCMTECFNESTDVGFFYFIPENDQTILSSSSSF